MQETMQSIQADLRALLSQRAAFARETNFVARAQAMDTLTFRILERIENLQYVHGYQAPLAQVHQQAVQLWEQLAAVNTALFQRLRTCLGAGEAIGLALTQLCDLYVGPETPPPSWSDMDADYLDVFLNGLLGMDFVPAETRALQAGMIGYHPTPARVIFALINHLQLQATDVFYDLGSGLGRVVLLVGLLTPAWAKGIEFEPAYCAYAQQRAADLSLARVAFLPSDARQAAYHDGTVFFLYTPFTGPMLREVLHRLQEIARRHPIRLATYGACTRDVAQQPWVTLAAQQSFPPDTLSVFTTAGV